ncbi:MAG: class I SAM-dependent methyltransferase [Deltaproteobacteria bacterium]|nr:class I SAM-dependent methyltransferase [Deltaproteobacteria bacterium]
MRRDEIPVEEIDFHPTSFCDRDGRVFWWKGELYRGITETYAGLCKKLFADGIAQKLVEKKFLVETELTNLTLNGYELVLKHRRVPFVSYANEWCPEMLRDAGLFITDMMLELGGYGLLLDVDTWDMLFDQCQPVYVDFCSIMAADSSDKYLLDLIRDDFRSYFIYPLQLMARGYGNLARWLLSDYEHKVIQAEFAALMGHQIYNFTENHGPLSSLSIIRRRIRQSVRPLFRKGIGLIASGMSKSVSDVNLKSDDLVRQLRHELLSIAPPPAREKQTGGENCFRSLTPADDWTPKHHLVYKVLSDLCPATVLDMGSGQGWYSQLAASLGSSVVAIDVDDRCVAACYQEARNKNLPILPLVMDIRYPSPGHGTCNQVIAPALQRLPCEMVLALSLVDLLVFNQYLTFEQTCQTFAAFSKKWLLVEFADREDREVRQRWTKWHSWYTLENFLDVLKKQFRRVSTIPSHPASRVLLLCEK